MPVVDGGRLVGMLTVTDVLRVFVEQNEDRQERKPLSEQTVTS
jgi:CBS domain-containing protein